MNEENVNSDDRHLSSINNELNKRIKEILGQNKVTFYKCVEILK